MMTGHRVLPGKQMNRSDRWKQEVIFKRRFSSCFFAVAVNVCEQ